MGVSYADILKDVNHAELIVLLGRAENSNNKEFLDSIRNELKRRRDK